MAKVSKFKLIINGETIPLLVVSNLTWGDKQQVIVYESAGTNGGTVITTGRLNKQKVLNGKLIAPPNKTINEVKNQILDALEQSLPVTLISPFNDNDTGNYIIEEFTGNVLEGINSYLPFSLTLTEYRQANIKKAKVNLISFEPAETIRNLLIERGKATPK